MGHAGGLDHPDSFQLNLLSAELIEQSNAFTEQHGHQVNLYFVKQPGTQVLL
jgi:hypothetical protein